MHLLILTLILCFSLLAVPLQAELILDDFVDPVETSSPEMQGLSIVTDSVGPLMATRELRIAAFTSFLRPTITTLKVADGSMMAEIEKVGTTQDGRSTTFAFNFSYEFAPTDVSEQGNNDAIFVDFATIAGNEQPGSFGLIVDDNTTDKLYLSETQLSATESPLTVAIPFTSFTTRGGAIGLPDPNTFKSMAFDFFFNQPRLDIQWSAEIESIRFGRLVPEPASWLLCSVALLFISERSFH